MGSRDLPLNPVQLEVLRWVRDGSQPGLYKDWSHRITARALHNRGLLDVKGHGKAWSAALTEDGTFYLAHDHYPEPPTTDPGPSPRATSTRKPTKHSSTSPPARPAPQSPLADKAPARPKERLPGPVDQLMASLTASDDHSVSVPSREEARYRQLVGAAKRFGRVPDDMQFSFGHQRDGDEFKFRIVLEPRPAWHMKVLEPLPVKQDLKNASDIVQKLADRDGFQVEGPPRERALRLIETLVTEARERGMKVKAARQS